MAAARKKIVRIARQNKGDDADESKTEPRRDARDQYHELLDSIYDAVLITDADATVIEVNQRAVDALQYGEDELVGIGILSLIPDADVSFLKTLKNMPEQQYALIETRCRRKDGSCYPSEIAVKSIGGRGNNLSFFIRNISKRREAESRFRLVNNAVHNCLTAIVITDECGLIEFANPVAAGIFGSGFDPSAASGAEIGRFFVEKEKMQECFESLKKLESWQGEMTVEQDARTMINTEVAAAPNEDEGRINGFVFSMLDITNEKAAEEQRRINARNAATIATLGAACHHLAQPATVLCANAEIMGADPGNADREDLKEMIAQNASAAADMQAKLRRLNDVTLYRTEHYLQNEDGIDDLSNTILAIDGNDD